MSNKLLNNKAVKEYANSKGFRTSGDFSESLNEEIISLIDKSIERGEKNGRKTLMSYDI